MSEIDKRTSAQNCIGYQSAGTIPQGGLRFAIAPGAKVAGVLNEAEQQNLAEAAAEIQQLLKQLESTNPTVTETDRITIAAKAAEEIRKNPTLKARVMAAIKSGAVESFKAAVDNPLVNVLVAMLFQSR